MIYNTVLFDFDGTIADTGEGIMKSAKYALDSLNIPCPDDYREMTYFIGPPLLVTFQEQFNQDVATADTLVEKFRERYNDTGIFESEVYDGIENVLISLKKENVKIGVASSKPEKYVKQLLKKFKIEKYFDSICGVSFGKDCEPKSSIVARCIEELNADKNSTLMVGDKKYDVEGAKENRIDCTGVLWGYGTKIELAEAGAKFIAEKPDDIESIALGFYEQTEEYGGIYKGKIITVHNDTITQVDGREAKREIVDHNGGVAIVGITEENEVLLVRQFRYAYKETILEIPAGKLEKGEDPLEAGIREFKEECGAVAKNVFPLGHIYPTPGYCSEKIYLYGATDITFSSQNLDDGENLEVIRMPFDEVIDRIMSGEIKDSKTIVGLFKMKELNSK